MSVKEEIIDYVTYSEEIEKWLKLKGEIKYIRFASILKGHNANITWNILKDTYRYDKRLLVNIFKYLSFFEEFLRAQVWNISQVGYKKLENATLSEIIESVIRLKDKINYAGFSINTLENNKSYINYLRNRVSHNKIILESEKDGKEINGLLIAFKETLPESYMFGFISDINNCQDRLHLLESMIIRI